MQISSKHSASPPTLTPACRLRAALNATQGLGSDPFYLQQLGLTPGSAVLDPAGGGRGGMTARGTKRASSGLLRRDSESGMASEK
jgi:hypothetical protein